MKLWVLINLWAQIIIFIISIFSLAIEPLFALFMTIPFGLWQVIAGIVFAIRSHLLSSKNKLFVTIYLIVTAVVLGLLTIGFTNGLSNSSEFTFIGAIAFMCSILGIAFFVFSLKLLKNEPDNLKDALPEILDQL